MIFLEKEPTGKCRLFLSLSDPRGHKRWKWNRNWMNALFDKSDSEWIYVSFSGKVFHRPEYEEYYPNSIDNRKENNANQ